MAERTHLFRLVRWVEAVKHRHDLAEEHKQRAIRMYCESHGHSWILQVRAPVKLGSTGQDGKDFIVASAHLDRDDLVALRDACNALLEES